MKERIFTDKNGEQLIVRHRKSAIFFLREADITKVTPYRPFFSPDAPIQHYINSSEMKRRFQFAPDAFSELYLYLEQIAQEAWKDFEPKSADNMRADYFEYYDRERDSNGYCSLRNNELFLDGPSHLVEEGPIVQLYKFNKRKFESLLHDYHHLLIKRSEQHAS